MLRFSSVGIKSASCSYINKSIQLQGSRGYSAISNANEEDRAQVTNVFSVFPSIHDLKPEDILGHNKFGYGKYFVGRSTMGNLPVYTDFKSGGNRIVTEIRKIDGDIIKLRNDMQEALPHIPKKLWKVVIQSKKIIIKGDFVHDVKNVLGKKF